MPVPQCIGLPIAQAEDLCRAAGYTARVVEYTRNKHTPDKELDSLCVVRQREQESTPFMVELVVCAFYRKITD